MSTPSDPSLTPTDHYRLVRAQIEFEDGLIVQRLNWLMASQSFLFTAYAITLNAPVQSSRVLFSAHQRIIFHIIPLVALAACLLIYTGMVGGVLAQKHLRRFLREHLAPEHTLQPPPVHGARLSR